MEIQEVITNKVTVNTVNNNTISTAKVPIKDMAEDKDKATMEAPKVTTIGGTDKIKIITLQVTGRTQVAKAKCGTNSNNNLVAMDKTARVAITNYFLVFFSPSYA